MKKVIILGVVLLLNLSLFAACAKTDDRESVIDMIGTSRDTVLQVVGEPTAMLSGFFGDIYAVENGTKIIIYYDADENVSHIRVEDSSGKITWENTGND